MVDVVSSYDIFTSDTGGHTGQAVRVSQQMLQNTFGRDLKQIEILQKILEEGSISQYQRGSRLLKEHGAHVTRDHTVEVR